MIAFLSGKIIAFLNDKIIVKTPSGVGYLLTVDPRVDMILNENFDFFVLEVSRDSANELYGFQNVEQRVWVDKLICVDGVGPKTATMIIYQLGIEQIKLAIENQDDLELAKVKGVSSKTAKKIILELHNKNVDIKTLNQNRTKPNSQKGLKSSITQDFTETLSSLGYSRSQVVNVITAMKNDDQWQEQDLNQLVKVALKYL
jgi:holliday junction DNA helicase RuvA